MAYITNTDIEKRLGTATYVQLADDNGDGAADAPVVDEARLGAEGEVNGYLASRFQVPIDTTLHPELLGTLASMALDIAEYRLRCRRPPVPSDVIDKRDAAVAWLRGVAEGRIELPSATELASNTAQGILAAKKGEARVLSHQELREF